MSVGVLALLSGGLDSIAMCRLLQRRTGLVHLVGAMTVDYGQPAAIEETTAAAKWCHLAGLPWCEKAITLDAVHLDADGGPCLVPARNAALLSLAANWAPRMGASAVAIGATASDRRDYPDCRGEFITDLSGVFQRAYRVQLLAPLADMEKHEVVALLAPVDLEIAFSCYTPAGMGRACGRCRSCADRAAALAARESLPQREPGDYTGLDEVGADPFMEWMEAKRRDGGR